MAIEVTEDYRSLLVAVKHRIRAAQYEALKAVNRELMALYWDIGELIVTRQEIAGWGKSVVEQLAKDLQVEFHGMAGFSARNIWRMRDFYLTYHGNENWHHWWQKLAGLIIWWSWRSVKTICRESFTFAWHKNLAGQKCVNSPNREQNLRKDFAESNKFRSHFIRGDALIALSLRLRMHIHLIFWS